MLIARRGNRIFYSDELGVINLDDRSVTKVSLDSALRWGYWSDDPQNSRLFEDAVSFEAAMIVEKRTKEESHNEANRRQK